MPKPKTTTPLQKVIREGIEHARNAERSLREDRLIHTDNNIRAVLRCLIRALTMLDDSNTKGVQGSVWARRREFEAQHGRITEDVELPPRRARGTK